MYSNGLYEVISEYSDWSSDTYVEMFISSFFDNPDCFYDYS
jgi:hypothetical protein